MSQCSIAARFGPCVLVRLIVVLLCTLPGLANAKSHLYVNNETNDVLSVSSVHVGGDPISKKAWKKGPSTIPAGQKVRVLTVNRSGKVNWMDPTPRFVEPGKTTIFTTHINLPDQQEGDLLLKLKLLGTGKSSKMWYSTGGVSDDVEWTQAAGTFASQWQTTSLSVYDVSWRAFEEEGKIHLEYHIRPVD